MTAKLRLPKVLASNLAPADTNTLHIQHCKTSPKSIHSATMWLRFMLVAAALFTTGGCQSVEDSKLAGTWHADAVEKVAEQVNQLNDESAEDQDSVQDSLPQMSITFKPGGVLETATKMGKLEVNKNGTWKVITVDDSQTAFVVQCVLAEQKTEHEIEMIDDETMRLAPPNMAGVNRKMTFRRK